MSEYDPYRIRIVGNPEGETNEWFDDEQFTHKHNDTLYIRHDKVIDFLLEKGYTVTLTARTINGWDGAAYE